MRKLFLMLSALFFITASCNREQAEVNPAASKNTTELNSARAAVAVGTKLFRQGCRYCTCGRGNCQIAVYDEPSWVITPTTPTAEVYIEGNVLRMSFTSQVNEEDGNVLTLSSEDEYYIDTEVAEILGYNAVKVLAGSYTIDFNDGPYGSVNLNVATN